MHPYKKGRLFEYKVKKEFEKRGYYVVRSAGSKGVFDLIAIGNGEVLGIQCKLGKVSEGEIREMLEVGRRYGIIPIIATKDGVKVIMFRSPEPNIKYRKPIVLNVKYGEEYNTWDLSNDELGICSCGCSMDEALIDAEVCLKVLVDEYLLESNDNLTEKALELKRMVAEYIEVVQR